MRIGVLCVSMALLAGGVLMSCAHPAADDTQAQDGLFIRGEGTVVTVEPELGHAVLEVDGRRMDAYWQVESYVPRGGYVVQNDPLRGPVGQYQEPVTRVQQFHAAPGDRVRFTGMKTATGVLLRGIQVVKPAG